MLPYDYEGYTLSNALERGLGTKKRKKKRKKKNIMMNIRNGCWLVVKKKVALQINE